MTIRPALLTMAIVLAACSTPALDDSAPGELTDIDEAAFVSLIETSEQPMVVNLWASWCVPCRSEAPLLEEAHALFGEDVRFIGIATEDGRDTALGFVDEFGLTFENYFDPDAEIKAWVGSLGLPTTFFVAEGGEVVSTVFGVVDERRLALEIDDLLRR